MLVTLDPRLTGPLLPELGCAVGNMLDAVLTAKALELRRNFLRERAYRSSHPNWSKSRSEPCPDLIAVRYRQPMISLAPVVSGGP
jgi:hypothetical protein